MQLAPELARLIDAEVERLKENLTNMSTFESLSAYTAVAGEIKGLRTARDLLEEAQTHVEKAR
jgi:hypothetical protein